MPGKIIDIKVSIGDKINAGDSVIIIEAMKMENEIQALESGTVVAINIRKGDEVSPNETLLEIQS
jgi:pyruvate carboxylase subunit B